MPRIDPRVLNCAFFLYPTKEDALAGRNFGGTGFLVSVPSAVADRNFVVAVTNWHVACRGNSVLRLNTKQGGVEVLDAAPEDWSFDPRYDIAILPLSIEEGDQLERSQVKTSAFVSRDYLTHEKAIGPGEDVFMIGRFIDHDGGGVNLPTVRFGNISALPTPIIQENGTKAPAFILDMHSRSGYSGSPVFAYRTPGYDLQIINSAEPRLLLDTPNLFVLLGIHIGQFPERWEILSGAVNQQEAAEIALITEGTAVKGFSGMTCVLPAWCIQEVIDMPKHKEARDQINAQLLAERATHSQSSPGEQGSTADPNLGNEGL